MKFGYRAFSLLVLGGALALGCKKDEPKSTRWDDAAAALSEAPASSAPKMATGAFNKFFPKDGEGGYEHTFSADKEGYAEAKFKVAGREMATGSIADADQNPDAKAKFKDATEKVDGFPAITVGKNQTAVLVKDRYQVKCSSTTLGHEQRKVILSTFDLQGLNKL